MKISTTSKPTRNLFRICGWISVVGIILVLLADLVGIWVVDGYNPITQTISDLAIGDFGWIQDLGLDAYAIGLIASAIALFRWDLGQWKWKTGSILLVLLGLDILLIAEHNQYASLPENEGNAIHIYLVYALGILFPLIVLFLSSGLSRISKGWKYFSYAISACWVLFAPIFFQVPTNIDGLYERLIAVIMLIWSGAIAWLLIRQEKQ